MTSREVAHEGDSRHLEVRGEEFPDAALSTTSSAPPSGDEEIPERFADRPHGVKDGDDAGRATPEPSEDEVVTRPTPDVATATVPVDDHVAPAIRDPAGHQVDAEPTREVVTAPVAVADDVEREPAGRARADEASVDDRPATRVLKTPSFSLLAPIAGWLAAWGAAAVASSALIEAGVALGFGFGIADGSVDLDTGFWAGLWTLVVQAGAFLFGGYVAGRMARVRGTAHAVAAWIVAMLATTADAIVVATRDGGSSVLAPLHIPQWADLDYDRVVIIPLVIFALGSLIAALIGGLLASGANRIDTRDGVIS